MIPQEEIDSLTLNIQNNQKLPSRLKRWAREVATVALENKIPQAALDLVYDLLAICDRESLGGDALLPKGSGPKGTGDWTVRVGHWLKDPNVDVITDLDQSMIDAGWHHPRDNAKNIIPGPYAITKDRLGFGRSIIQVDYCVHPELMEKLPDGTPKWADPTTAFRYCAKIYLSDLAYFHGDKTKAFPSYNTGRHNVELGVNNHGDPDTFTTGFKDGKGYGKDCLKRRSQWI